MPPYGYTPTEFHEAVLAENEFSVAYVEAWAFCGVCPPPILGQPDSKTSVYTHLAFYERHAKHSAPLAVTDEQGVTLQRRDAEIAIRRKLDSTAMVDGETLVFPYGQEALKALGRWVEPTAELRGEHWSTLRPAFWIWGAEMNPDTRCLLRHSRSTRPPTATIRERLRLQEDARRFDLCLRRDLANDGTLA